MPVHITSRSDAEAIIREQVVSTIFQDAPKQSVFMSMARKLPNMTSDQTRIRVLDFLPTAYWVDGDTGMKQTSRQAWDNVYLDAAELAVIVPIPEAVLDDAEFDIFGEITPRVNEAIGQRVDSAIIFGVNRPRVWQNDIITLARQAGNNVAPGSTPDYYNLLLGENGVISKVEEDGYMATGALAAMGMRAKLRGIKATDGTRMDEDRVGCPFAYLEPATPVTTQTVTFTVKDNAGSPEAIEGAIVDVNGSRLKTNASGEAVFNLRPGTYPAKIKKTGYSQITETVTVVASAVTKDVTLIKNA